MLLRLLPPLLPEASLLHPLLPSLLYSSLLPLLPLLLTPLP